MSEGDVQPARDRMTEGDVWPAWEHIIEGFCPGWHTDDGMHALVVVAVDSKRWGYCPSCSVGWRAFTGGYIDHNGNPYGHTVESRLFPVPPAEAAVYPHALSPAQVLDRYRAELVR